MIHLKDINKNVLLLVKGPNGPKWTNYNQKVIRFLDNGDVVLEDENGRTLQTDRKNVIAIDAH